MPVDAERWLASRGIEREPLRVTPSDPPDADHALKAGSTPASATGKRPSQPHAPAEALEPDVVSDVVADVVQERDQDGPDRPSLVSDAPEETVEGALGFIRRSTSNAPQSEGRLRSKLADRGYPEPIIEEALVLARSERLVDDAAMIAALIIERRARGHADLRLRRDLRGRGFSGVQVDEALAQFACTDPAAAVFALAREQASRHRAVDAEAAVRRTVGFLVRRGHGEGLARKAARDAVYADREAQQVAER